MQSAPFEHFNCCSCSEEHLAGCGLPCFIHSDRSDKILGEDIVCPVSLCETAVKT